MIVIKAMIAAEEAEEKVVVEMNDEACIDDFTVINIVIELQI
jgi:hypothetical protein